MMAEFTQGKWGYVPYPMSLDGSEDDWYLVGSPEGTVGFIRHKADAELITRAPKMYKLLEECATALNAIQWLPTMSKECMELVTSIKEVVVANE